eukprot:CAMPEP_0194377254 /NCGR_PEP_ID=MMETSP0174-20130528/30184_1 /TAXON_ID=216777 /ORGANISM="Proboscia alata, Strain PI-D3" /LENGTH=43 /DNA_ID= /DNA_START= /DNA_END= /DNA_ORIENTATION=
MTTRSMEKMTSAIEAKKKAKEVAESEAKKRAKEVAEYKIIVDN